MKKLQQKIEEISRQRNVTVVVDMDIGLELKGRSGTRFREDPWGPQTLWAGKVAASLARSHIQKNPGSKTSLIGHSAGCEGMRAVEAIEKDSGEKLFNQPRFALSSRNPIDHDPKTTIHLMADGDFIATPGGALSIAASRTAEQLQQSGFTVARIVAGDGTGSRVWPDLSDLSIKNLATQGATFSKGIAAHAEMHRFFVRDQQVLLYIPGIASPIQRPRTSIDQVIKTMDAARPSGAADQASVIDPAKIESALTKLRASEPTPGIGGISLNAAATVPIDPETVIGAGYRAQEHRLFLNLVGGRKVFFPAMDEDVLRETHALAYVAGQKPELSIGSPPEGHSTTSAVTPDNIRVFYLGGSGNTMLGLVMLDADKALGTLAFSSTREVRPVSDKVPGFHSLPEIYDKAYASHPAQDKYPAANAIFCIQPR